MKNINILFLYNSRIFGKIPTHPSVRRGQKYLILLVSGHFYSTNPWNLGIVEWSTQFWWAELIWFDGQVTRICQLELIEFGDCIQYFLLLMEGVKTSKGRGGPFSFFKGVHTIFTLFMVGTHQIHNSRGRGVINNSIIFFFLRGGG